MFKARCHPLKKWLIIGVYSPPTHQSSSIIISCICQKNIRRCSIIAQKSGRNDGPAASILREKDPISSRTVGARTSRSRLPYLSSENDGFSWWTCGIFTSHQELRFSSAKSYQNSSKNDVQWWTGNHKWFFRRLRSSVEKSANFSCHFLIGPKVFN